LLVSFRTLQELDWTSQQSKRQRCFSVCSWN